VALGPVLDSTSFLNLLVNLSKLEASWMSLMVAVGVTLTYLKLVSASASWIAKSVAVKFKTVTISSGLQGGNYLRSSRMCLTVSCCK